MRRQAPYLPDDPHLNGDGVSANYVVDEVSTGLWTSTPSVSPPSSPMMDAQGKFVTRLMRQETAESQQSYPDGIDPWEFAGWGTATTINDIRRVSPSRPRTENDSLLPPKPKEHSLLGELAATAISGNDISSSCLYCAGICSYYAGKWAPLALVMVAGLLYLFRKIYTEVVSALPVNGGTYTALLNTTTKQVASVAACLTILSYVSTAVVSAATASAYFHSLVPEVHVEWMTVLILLVFAFLNLIGITESAPVAVAIFLVHLSTLTLLLVDCFIVAMKDDWQLLKLNWAMDLADVPEAHTYGFVYAILYGFSAGLLGISGFETSANFVEEQKPGVFPKTLRNMWYIVTLFNPIISFMAISVLPLPKAMGLPLRDGRPNNDDLLIDMASTQWLRTIVGVDAVCVLSGAVLTSYVGVTGLVRRMALDRCLPDVLLHTNKLRGTNHYIIIGFFLICTSLYFIMECNTVVLAGIYTMSFLSVMFLFGLGNLLLKYKRGKIARAARANLSSVVAAMVAVLVGLAGNVICNLNYVRYFALYFLVCLGIVFVMLYRTVFLKMFIKPLSKLRHDEHMWFGKKPTKWLTKRALELNAEIKSQRMVFFVKNENIVVLNKALLYVRQNEQTAWLQFVHCFEEETHLRRIKKEVRLLNKMYPKMRCDFIAVRGKFNRDMIELLSDYLMVPKHLMFIACPGKSEKTLNIADLGGVRIITY